MENISRSAAADLWDVSANHHAAMRAPDAVRNRAPKRPGA
jgi:hypothetical protein